MEENEELKEAVEKLDSLSEDERMQRIAELRDKAIRDEKAVYATGLEQGIERGKAEGRKESKREIAKKLLLKGMKVEDIIETTGLTKEEIEKL